MNAYEDIIHLEYPLATSDRVKHPRMSLQDRAKIFAPFAALRGYEQAIAKTQDDLLEKIKKNEKGETIVE